MSNSKKNEYKKFLEPLKDEFNLEDTILKDNNRNDHTIFYITTPSRNFYFFFEINLFKFSKITESPSFDKTKDNTVIILIGYPDERTKIYHSLSVSKVNTRKNQNQSSNNQSSNNQNTRYRFLSKEGGIVVHREPKKYGYEENTSNSTIQQNKEIISKIGVEVQNLNKTIQKNTSNISKIVKINNQLKRLSTIYPIFLDYNTANFNDILRYYCYNNLNDIIIPEYFKKINIDFIGNQNNENLDIYHIIKKEIGKYKLDITHFENLYFYNTNIENNPIQFSNRTSNNSHHLIYLHDLIPNNKKKPKNQNSNNQNNIENDYENVDLSIYIIKIIEYLKTILEKQLNIKNKQIKNNINIKNDLNQEREYDKLMYLLENIPLYEIGLTTQNINQNLYINEDKLKECIEDDNIYMIIYIYNFLYMKKNSIELIELVQETMKKNSISNLSSTSKNQLSDRKQLLETIDKLSKLGGIKESDSKLTKLSKYEIGCLFLENYIDGSIISTTNLLKKMKNEGMNNEQVRKNISDSYIKLFSQLYRILYIDIPRTEPLFHKIHSDLSKDTDYNWKWKDVMFLERKYKTNKNVDEVFQDFYKKMKIKNKDN